MDDVEEILRKVSLDFSLDTFFVPVIGSEIEFYLSGNIPDDILNILSASLKEAGVNTHDVKTEKGKGQYEVSIAHTDDFILAAKSIAEAREIIKDTAVEYGLQADFSPKPVPDDYGNAMHIHVSLMNKEGNNIFQKQGDDESELMKNAIGGLLELLPASMKYFTKDADYKRFVRKMDAPTTISWGGNNRTVALRLPTTTTEPHNRRIEYRPAAADADPYIVIACILAGINYGITNNLAPESEKIYGDASLEQYALHKLPSNYNEAKCISHEYIDELMGVFL